jgi:uncharacterized RDD family membrane protein YckC
MERSAGNRGSPPWRAMALAFAVGLALLVAGLVVASTVSVVLGLILAVPGVVLCGFAPLGVMLPEVRRARRAGPPPPPYGVLGWWASLIERPPRDRDR